MNSWYRQCFTSFWIFRHFAYAAFFNNESIKSLQCKALWAVSKMRNTASIQSLKPVFTKVASEVWLWLLRMMDWFLYTGINPTKEKGPCILTGDLLQPKALWLWLVQYHMTRIWWEETFLHWEAWHWMAFHSCVAIKAYDNQSFVCFGYQTLHLEM